MVSRSGRNPQNWLLRLILPALTLGVLFVFFVTPRVEDVPDSETASELPTGVSADWWSAVQQDLAEREYHVSEASEGLQAPNRAQDFRTYFREGAVEIVPRDPSAAKWSWIWETVSIGRPDGMRQVEKVPPTYDVARVEYAREGFTEWYENMSKGVEQGFTITERPSGVGRLTVVGTLHGDLAAEISEGADAVTFANQTGAPVMRYSDLVAWDADGRELPSEMLLTDGGIALCVDDQGAAYPIIIDPIMVAPNWYDQGDQVAASFGVSVATAGDVNSDGFSDVIVGAMNYDHGETDEGCAYVYMGTAYGLVGSPSWTGERNQAGALFGCSVASAGDVNADGYDDVVVGAKEYESVNADEGRAYLYYGSAAGLETSHAWSTSAHSTAAHFGSSVASAGDVNGDGYDDIIVGEEHGGPMDRWPGRAYVFHGTDTVPSVWADWEEANPIAYAGFAQFGFSVATAGDVNGDGYSDVIIGAPGTGWSGGEMAYKGSAHVYHGSAGGLAEDPAWSYEGSDFWEYLGNSVCTAGDVNGDGYSDVIVGAPYDDNPAVTDPGHTLIFHGSETGVESAPAWDVFGDQAKSQFGYYVATVGDVNGDGYSDVIVGAPLYDHGQTNEGRAYVYLGYWTGTKSDPIWIKESDKTEAHFGFSVATAGDVNGDGFTEVLVGAPEYDHPEDAEGLAFVYHGGSYGPQLSAGWVTQSGQLSALYGQSVAGVGDVNGDGYSDVAVGAPQYDNGELQEGAVFLFLGTHLGLAWVPSWYAEGNLVGGNLGTGVAPAGDVNGDGLADAIVGAYRYTNTENYEGAAFIWLSQPGGIPYGNPGNADWAVYGGQAGARFGYSVAGAGDVNGDGYSDVIVGAPLYDNPLEAEGAVFAYYGSETGPSATYDWLRDSGNAYAEYGTSVASAGDFNGDGYSDVIVGSPLFENPEYREGCVFVYTGSETGLQTGAPWWWAQSNQEEADFGRAVATAGDVNGDGFSDVVIGAWHYDTITQDGGAAFVYHGDETAPSVGDPDNADWKTELGHQQFASWGSSVASAGDVNGDGYSDILVGTPYYDGDVGYSAGLVGLWHGSDDGLSLGAAEWLVEGSQIGARFGEALASAGDVNGDGFSDIIIGSPWYNGNEADEGRAFIYYGNESRGLARTPQQWRSDLSTPIGVLGLSDSETEFALKARGRTAAGRGAVRMEVEVKPYGTPFNGNDTILGDWSDTGTPSGAPGSVVSLTETVTGLYAGTLYHWRLRVLSDNPLFPRTPWLTLPDNCATEADFRTAGTLIDVPGTDASIAGMQISNAPNPFNPRTTFTYRLSNEGAVRLAVYDAQGREVATLVDEVQRAGTHSVSWDARTERAAPLASGIYFARLESGGLERIRKIVLMK